MKEKIIEILKKHETGGEGHSVEGVLYHNYDIVAEEVCKLKSEEIKRIDNSFPLLRETIMRANLAMPETEQDEKWFEEKIDVKKDGDFMERVFNTLGLGNINP